MRIDAPARARWTAALAVGSLLAASPELHIAIEGDAAEHGLSSRHEMVATAAACELGGRAHFEPAEPRTVRPCAGCLRNLEQRAVAPEPVALSTADLGEPRRLEGSGRLVPTPSHGTRSVRGPPLPASS